MKASKEKETKDHRERLWEQERKEHGFDSRDTWSLDHTLAILFVPIIEKLKLNNKILLSFKLLKKGAWDLNNEQFEQVKIGLNQFSKNFLKFPVNIQKELLSVLIPRLRMFRKLNNGWPSDSEYKTFESWCEMLDSVINGLTSWWVTLDALVKVENKNEIKKNAQHSLTLLSTWFLNLWW